MAAPLVFHGSRHDKTIALTIDDCFSSAAVLADLAILQQARVNATWFPIGHVVASDPVTWRAVAAAGFPIANHTYDHANLTRYTYAQMVADIERDNEVVSTIIGAPLLPVVRPMGGMWNSTVLLAAAAAGERAVVIWDTTAADTAPLPGRATVDQLVRSATKGTSGSIILMHANLPYTQQALPRIIAYYQAQGYTFVTLGQLLGIDGPVPFPSSPDARGIPAPAGSPNPRHDAFVRGRRDLSLAPAGSVRPALAAKETAHRCRRGLCLTPLVAASSIWFKAGFLVDRRQRPTDVQSWRSRPGRHGPPRQDPSQARTL